MAVCVYTQREREQVNINNLQTTRGKKENPERKL